jgi:hypothetical protein
VFTLPAWECPHYDKVEIDANRRDLPENEFYEQYGGEWRFYKGRVYKVFREDLHLVEPFPVPSSWKLWTGTDFGYRDPTCTLWLAQSPTGEGYFVDEYYVKERDTKDHAKAMLEKEHLQGYQKPQVRIADAHGLGVQLIRDAAREGWITTSTKSHDRRARRDLGVRAFTPRPKSPPYHVREFGKGAAHDGKYPDVFLFKGRTPNYVEELRFLQFKETTRKEGSVGDTEGEDHAVDAGEYLMEWIRLGEPPRRLNPDRNLRQTRYRPVNALTGY